MNEFTDAAASAVAREIATIRREAQREREVREAQFAAKMAEMEVRITALADVERRLTERIASIKDGVDGKDGEDGCPGTDAVAPTAAEVAELIRSDAERAASDAARAVVDAWERPKDGEPGTSVTIEELAPIIEARVAEAVAAIPAPRDGRDADPAETERMIAETAERVLAGWDRPKDGTSVTVEDVMPAIEARIAAAVAAIPPVEPMPVDMDAVREIVADEVAKLPPAEPGEPGTSVTVDDVLPLIRSEVATAVSAIPIPENGKDADPAEIARLLVPEVERAVAQMEKVPGPPGEPGTSVTIEDVEPMLRELVGERVAKAVAEIPAPKGIEDIRVQQIGEEALLFRFAIGETEHRFEVDLPRGANGADADPAVMRQMVEECVAQIPPAKDGESVSVEEVETMVRDVAGEILAAWPRPQDGRSVTLEDVAPIIAEQVERSVAAIPKPKDGEPGPVGPMGALPIVGAWEDRVYYQGEVCAFDGGAYQAARDTGKAPPHEDWTCIVSRGRDGKDGQSFSIRGTYDSEAEYKRLDVVALNGASFAARRDDPGTCPGEGWQLIASQGKQGKPGDKGIGLRGLPGAPVKDVTITDDALLTIVNGDGTEVTCDLYPILSKIG